MPALPQDGGAQHLEMVMLAARRLGRRSGAG